MNAATILASLAMLIWLSSVAIVALGSERSRHR